MNLVGEGADDAGGVFDETLAQMCEVRRMREIVFVHYSSFGIRVKYMSKIA